VSVLWLFLMENLSRVNPFSRENASEKTSHFHFALPHQNERRREGREINTQTNREKKKKKILLRFTALETSTSCKNTIQKA